MHDLRANFNISEIDEGFMKAITILLFAGLLFYRAPAQSDVPSPMKDDDAASVVVFLSPSCPVSQKYIPTLNAIYDKYAAQNVEFFAIIPGKVTMKERKTFITDYAVKFQVRPDKKFRWATSMEARITPEVFVFDRNDVVQYRGAIDNWFYDLGRYRSEPTDHYLTNAVEAVLAGKAPEVTATEATGCSIQSPQ